MSATLDDEKATRLSDLRHNVRAYVDGIVSPGDREMCLIDILKHVRGLPVSPLRLATALAVEAFADRARDEADRVTAACAACEMVEELAFVWIDVSAIGVP